MFYHSEFMANKMSDSEDSIGLGSSRVPLLTEKGKTYHSQILENQKSSTQRSWRKQLNRVINVIADTTNQNLIMSEKIITACHINSSVSQTPPERIKLQMQRLKCAQLEQEFHEMKAEI